jgi:hypothetical protein
MTCALKALSITPAGPIKTWHKNPGAGSWLSLTRLGASAQPGTALAFSITTIFMLNMGRSAFVSPKPLKVNPDAARRLACRGI